MGTVDGVGVGLTVGKAVGRGVGAVGSADGIAVVGTADGKGVGTTVGKDITARSVYVMTTMNLLCTKHSGAVSAALAVAEMTTEPPLFGLKSASAMG